VLRAAIRNRNPVLFFEHKGLYGRKGLVRRGNVAEFGKAEILREGADVTILSTLLMAQRSLAAAEELADEGIDVEVIDMRWLRPLDLDTARASIDKTGRLLVVEEQVHAAGWGATVISRLTMEGRQWASPPQTLGLSDDLLIPYSPPLEDESIPSAGAIAERVRAVAGQAKG
jgi:acetoin:2,6-dichlorophenolindophenol oxidoreductase subunit beta